MNKFLIFSAMFGVSLAIILLIGATGVLAVEGDQDTVVIVEEDIHVEITPASLDFGTVKPGEAKPAVNGPIGFNADGSNVDVNIEVTGVTGFPFDTGLKLDGLPALESSWDLLCAIVSNICTYTPQSTVPTLDIPLGAAQGINEGMIEYTITGSPPGP